MTYHVAGLDLSLARTGIVVFRGDDEADENGQLRPTVTAIESKPIKSGVNPDGKPYVTLYDTQRRLRGLAGRIVRAAYTGYDPEVDDVPLFVIERMFPSMEYGVFDRGWLRALVIDALIQRGAFVVEVTGSAAKRYATGSGGSRKGSNPKAGILLAIGSMYPAAFITDDNEADAAVLGGMGCRAIGHPREPSVQRVTAGVLDSVAWPSATASRNARAE